MTKLITDFSLIELNPELDAGSNAINVKSSVPNLRSGISLTPAGSAAVGLNIYNTDSLTDYGFAGLYIHPTMEDTLVLGSRAVGAGVRPSKLNTSLALTIPTLTVSGTTTLDPGLTGIARLTAGVVSADVVNVADLGHDAIATMYNGWIGACEYPVKVDITSNGSVVTLSVQRDPTGDLDIIFSGGLVKVDCTPALTIQLTAGSDSIPQSNYIYITKANPTVLTKSTTGFPTDEEYFRIGEYSVQGAASVQTYGLLRSYSYSHEVWKDTTQNGHVSHINNWIRRQHATYVGGVVFTPTITPGPPDTLTIATSAGVVSQLHNMIFPLFNSATAGSTNLTTFFSPNHPTPFTSGKNLNTSPFLRTTGNVAVSGNQTRISWVIWGAIDHAENTKLFVNLPGGFYTDNDNAIADPNRYTNYTIPRDYTGLGFLIAKLTYRVAADGALTLVENIDLRGMEPSRAAGGTNFLNSTFPDNIFSIFDETDPTKQLLVSVGGNTTGATTTLASVATGNRVITLPNVTDTLAVLGANTFTGAQSFPAGTVSLPSIHFNTDTSTGLYRIGANNIGVAISGANVLDVSATAVTMTGELRGPATFIIDPSAIGDNTGLVLIRGNLQVDGDTTTINSVTLEVDDKNIVLASGAITAAAADGGGITLDGAAATILYASADDSWNLNKKLNLGSGLSLTAAASFGAGTVSLPSIYLSTDTTTGLYRTGANQIGFTVSGTNRLNVHSTGATITGNIDLASTTDYEPQFITRHNGSTVASAGYFLARRSRAGSTAVVNGDTLGTLIFQGHDGTGWVNGPYITSAVDGAVSTGVVPAKIQFCVGGVERMAIASDGIITLGGTSAAPSLKVSSTASQNQWVTILGDLNNGPRIQAAGATPANLYLSSAGTGGVYFYTGSIGSLQFGVLNRTTTDRHITVRGGYSVTPTYATIATNSGGMIITPHNGVAGGEAFVHILSNLNGVTPTHATSLGVHIGGNHSAGNGDTDFFNPFYTATISFDFRQMTASGVSSSVCRMNPVSSGARNVVITQATASGNPSIGVSAGSLAVGLKGTAPLLRLEAMDGTNEGGEISFGGAAANGDVGMDNYAGQLRISNTGGVRAILDTAGNLSIGSATVATNTLRFLDVYNVDNGANAGSIIRLVTRNAADSGNITVDMVKYKTGEFRISNNEPSSTGHIYLFAWGAPQLQIKAISGATRYVTIEGSSAGNATIGTIGGGSLTLTSTSGNVLIGAAADLAKFNVVNASTTVVANNILLGLGNNDTNFQTLVKCGPNTAGAQVVTSIGMDYSTTYIDLAAIKFWRTGGAGGELRFFTGSVANGTEKMRIDSLGNVGIGMTPTVAFKLEVNGAFAATTKSFVIKHPTKPGKKLVHGSLEGPENGVYVRGKTKSNIIELPEYWTKLVDQDSITVQLTAVGNSQKLYVEKIENNRVYIRNDNMLNKEISCFYFIQGERIDVAKLEVEPNE